MSQPPPTCPICLDLVEQDIYQTTCQPKAHIFHKECISIWLKQYKTCPYCIQLQVIPSSDPVLFPSFMKHTIVLITTTDIDNCIHDLEQFGAKPLVRQITYDWAYMPENNMFYVELDNNDDLPDGNLIKQIVSSDEIWVRQLYRPYETKRFNNVILFVTKDEQGHLPFKYDESIKRRIKYRYSEDDFFLELL